MKRRNILLAPGIWILATTVITHAAEPAFPVVTVVPALRESLVDRLNVTGTLVAREEVEISARIDGLAITAIDAEEGDHIAAGQVLARLAHETLDTQLAQARAREAHAKAALAMTKGQLAAAEATQLQAVAAFSRIRALMGSGAVSRDLFEQRQMEADVATAKLAELQASLQSDKADDALATAQCQEVELRIGYAEIRAPVAGVISRRSARLGVVVGVASGALFHIVADGAVELAADVPETVLSRLKPGESARITTASSAIARAGGVRLVSPEISPRTRLGAARIAFADGGAGLFIGGFARASVEVAQREDVVTAPISALLFGPDGPCVQVVVDGIVQTRRVGVGLSTNGRVELTHGVTEGSEMVAVFGVFVRNGDRVAPVRRVENANRQD